MAKRPKAKRFSIQAYDNKHYQTTEQYTRAVDALFDAATKAITQEAAKGKYDPGKPFEYADHPKVKAVMQNVTAQLASRLTTVIESGSKKQWLFACEKNDGFIASIMDTSKLSKARLKKMQDRNLDALSAFQERKVNGMNLSQRVWKYVGQYKDQMENALDVGLGEGHSAQQLARDVKQNLQEPNRLFRRVRDKRGNLVLSKNAKAYHPGQGVYRSSVKNAQRLTRSEINMAYRESDWQRWQTLDFVVGFEICRSNHDPLPKCDLCEKLKGKYPKSFKFKGWHPQCMCYCIPILADEETFDENELGDLKAALHGTTYEHKAAKNTVLDVPQAFKDWVDEHKEAQDNWGSTPYFIKDNFVDGDLTKGLKFEPIQVKQQVANTVVPIRVPLSEMPEADVQVERARWELLNKELEEMLDALYSYHIPFDKAQDLIYNVFYGGRKDAEYWRYDEAKAELGRVKQELLNAIDTMRKQAREKMSLYADAVEDAVAWIETRKFTNEYLRYSNSFDAEKQKKYGIYGSFLTPSLLDTGAIKAKVADMKAKYNKAIADANNAIANANGADVTRLKQLVATKPEEFNPAYKIIADIEDAIKYLKNDGKPKEIIEIEVAAETIVGSTMKDRVQKIVDMETKNENVPLKLIETQKSFNMQDKQNAKPTNRNVDIYETRIGIKIVIPRGKNVQEVQEFTVEQVANAIERLPKELRASINEVYLCDFRNPWDSYWAKAYKAKGFYSYATGGQGTVRFYANKGYINDDDSLLSTLSHEIGHNIDTILHKISGNDVWAKAVQYDIKNGIGTKSVTDYGGKHVQEDFAESVMLYVKDSTKFKNDFPARYAILSKIFT